MVKAILNRLSTSPQRFDKRENHCKRALKGLDSIGSEVGTLYGYSKVYIANPYNLFENLFHAVSRNIPVKSTLWITDFICFVWYIYIYKFNFISPLSHPFAAFLARLLDLISRNQKVAGSSPVEDSDTFSEHLSLMNVTSHLFTNQARSPMYITHITAYIHAAAA